MNLTHTLVDYLAKRPGATIAEISAALGHSGDKVTNTISRAKLRGHLVRTNPGEQYATYVATDAGHAALAEPEIGFRDPRAKPLPVDTTPEAIVTAALRSRPALATVWRTEIHNERTTP